MKIIKRSGAEAIFDANKIAQAVKKANDSVVEAERLSHHQIAHIVEKVEKQCLAVNRSLNVEEIQDLVENAIMREQAFSVARNYVRYRYERELARTHNTTDERIKSILECNNEEVKQENSNKNPTVNSVQRDYIAGEVNKDFTRRFLLPEDIVEAHDAGIIHFHDTDYYAKLALDQSSPFFNKATQQTTAPGSTLKLLSTIAGMEEGIIDEGTYIECTGTFDYVDPPINCWYKNGHGSLDIRTAIEQSCNVFFNTIGFELGKDSEGNFSEARSLGMLQKYASLMGLDRKTGIEISEASPQVSDKNAVPSYIGQGTNMFTTSQLARYATTIATSGSIYKLSLLNRVTDSKGNLVKKYDSEKEGRCVNMHI